MYDQMHGATCWMLLPPVLAYALPFWLCGVACGERQALAAWRRWPCAAGKCRARARCCGSASSLSARVITLPAWLPGGDGDAGFTAPGVVLWVRHEPEIVFRRIDNNSNKKCGDLAGGASITFLRFCASIVL